MPEFAMRYARDAQGVVREFKLLAGLVLLGQLVPLGTGFAVAVLLTFSRWQASASLEAAPALGAILTAASIKRDHPSLVRR